MRLSCIPHPSVTRGRNHIRVFVDLSSLALWTSRFPVQPHFQCPCIMLANTGHILQSKRRNCGIEMGPGTCPSDIVPALACCLPACSLEESLTLLVHTWSVHLDEPDQRCHGVMCTSFHSTSCSGCCFLSILRSKADFSDSAGEALDSGRRGE